MSGPSEEAEKKIIGTEEFIFINSCKPHACDTDHLAIAYSKSSRSVFAKLRVDAGEPTMLGAPPDQVKSELEAYYKKRFSNQ